MGSSSATIRFTIGLVLALARRPSLVRTALHQVRVVAPSRWWSRRPWLPVPESKYLQFRQVTATGSADGLPSVNDTMLWLDWCRSMRALPGRRPF